MSLPLSGPIRLGLMAPLTGIAGLYGEEICRAARIAVDEVNRAGGVFGRPLELVIEDDGSLPETAVPAAERLVDEHGCVAMIGNLLSNSRIAVACRVATPRRVPLLNFSFYEGSICEPFFFSFSVLPNQQIEPMVPFMARRHGSKMFFAGHNYEWPRGSIDAAKQVLLALGGDVVGEEYLPFDVSEQELAILLEQVSRSGADVFVPYFAGQDQVRLFRRCAAIGLNRRMALVSGHFDEIMAGQLSREARQGIYAVNSYFMSVDTQANRDVLQRLSDLPDVTGIWPRGNGVLTHFGEGVYVCVHAFAQAVQRAGGLTPEALCAALGRVRVSAPQGDVSMDPELRHAQVNSYLARCNANGGFSVIESFGGISPLIPERYQTSSRLLGSQPQTLLGQFISAPAPDGHADTGLAQHILAWADIAILTADAQGMLTHVNRRACELFGYEEGELVGQSVHLLVPPHMRERHAQFYQQFLDGPEEERRMSERAEITGYHKDGSFLSLEASIAKFHEHGVWNLVVTVLDISARKRAEKELLWRATHDVLTGLPNRSLMHERVGNALERSRRHGLNVAMLHLGLDGFKLINDSHDRQTGDALLMAVSRRLLDQVRPGDTVARLAGDEFAILAEQVGQPAAIAGLAERLNEAMRQPFELNGVPVVVTASIGVATGQGSTHSADDVMRCAETALHALKQQGRDGWQFFNDYQHHQALQRLNVTLGLRMAIDNQELQARFQPILSSDRGRIVGAELLLRWFPPQGEVSPAVFIPIAEMSGVILPIGLWVFRTGCLAEVEWRRRWGTAAPYVSINLSARQLSDESLVDDMRCVLQETEADPVRIVLEVTETALMADIDANLRVLRRLAELGLRLAVDDFGTGYSSLAQLTRLPVSILKIDRAFVDGIETRHESRAVVRAVIGLGRSLGLALVAEGVETQGQHLELLNGGCGLFQGYLFHPPMRPEDFVRLMDAQSDFEHGEDQGTESFVLYVSRTVEPLGDESLQAILRTARIANARSGVTGFLIYQDGQFMQMLEGPRAQVEATMARIRLDPRHEDVHIVAEGDIRTRVFSDWSMGFQDMSRSSGEPDFSQWQRRTISLLELAEDAHTCYAYISAFAGKADTGVEGGSPTDAETS
ncbi:ABC transporter substrate-binding protein [Ectothiorhodospira lacustris]|uniref:ABC transporter substrate-binding protein n=1 Tax=Ectothiorhodospira lacustris TaxID=2899127 RepID=UPI001EE784DF|nr:ABC transporter substrate-binding protein [Ectothiorhodospira lacustris]MCG5508749.1 ABC transporter substrate-binding protein [Ectothiorhodospira lacustris]MCG5520540.1 ABC transporter substrate-binding protein [Ectothiorhodospira lacustris]